MKILLIIALIGLIWYLIIPNSSVYYKSYVFKPFFNRLNERDIIMVPGETFKLRVQRVNIRVKFSSLDIKVAEVTPLGTIIAFRPGKTFIRVKYNDKELRCRVRVVKLNKKEIELKEGETYRLDLKGTNIFNKIKWSSSDSKVVKVNRFGKVRAISKGKAVITAKIGDKHLKCKVVVK